MHNFNVIGGFDTCISLFLTWWLALSLMVKAIPA